MITYEKIAYTVESATASNTRNIQKPNEDYIAYDEQSHLLILLDGITRVHSEYSDRPLHSACCEINELFADCVTGFFKTHTASEENVESLLRDAVKKGNQAINKYRAHKNIDKWVYYPGTLGIVAIILEDKLHYICTGDCQGMIIRGNSKLFFGEQCSVDVAGLFNASKQERYNNYCNKPESRYSYTIFNGDEGVEEYSEYSYIDLHKGDVVFLYSDGIKDCIRYEKSALLRSLSTNEIISLAVDYDHLPFAEYGDDKSIIKLTF